MEESKQQHEEEEKLFEVDTKDAAKVKVPPRPVPLYPRSEENDFPVYKGDPKHIPKRSAHKLYNVWMLWISIRCNEKLEEILKKESDQDTEEFLLKSTIVQIIDHLAKILTDGDILEEVGKLIRMEAQADE